MICWDCKIGMMVWLMHTWVLIIIALKWPRPVVNNTGDSEEEVVVGALLKSISCSCVQGQSTKASAERVSSFRAPRRSKVNIHWQPVMTCLLLQTHYNAFNFCHRQHFSLSITIDGFFILVFAKSQGVCNESGQWSI